MFSEIGEANRSPRPDHQPQDAVAARQISDERTLLGIDAVGDKALQEAAIRCQHANGSVLGPYDLGRHLYYALEHPFQGHFGDQRRSGYNQPLQPRASRNRTGNWGLSHSGSYSERSPPRNPGKIRTALMLSSWPRR
jgi:hypothetical protein